jgi:uncharacterized protein YdaU (DUF1376 family)
MKKGYEMHFYPHHIGDFLKDTSSLTPEESYYYLRLIWLYYDTEKPLPDDIASLAFKIGARGKEDCVRNLVQIYFTYDSDLKSHTHQRIDEEISKYQEKADSARRANQIRWGSKKDLKSDLKSDAEQIPTNNQEPRTNKDKGLASKPDEVSDQIWSDFLRVRKAHNAPITKTALARIIMESVKANLTVEEVLKLCVEKNWRGFEAEWLKDKKGPKPLDQFAGAL